jgi:protease-4
MQHNPETETTTPAAEPQWATDLRKTLDAVQGLVGVHVASKRRDSNWAMVKRAFIGTVVLGVLCLYVVFYARALGFQTDPIARAVALVPIEGTIAPGLDASAENIVPIIERACAATHVDSLVLDINSGGGAPAEAERIIAAVKQCRAGKGDKPGKAVYALINGVGASAAYMIAMNTDEVFAGRYSIVGSIGAIMRLNDASELAHRLGVKELTYRSAPLKGGPSMLSGSTPADDQAANDLVLSMGQLFLSQVQAARGDALKLPAEEVSSGRVWTAEQALEAGLIDEIAVLEDLKQSKFEGRKIHRYETKPSLVESMGLAEVLYQVVADMSQPTIR